MTITDQDLSRLIEANYDLDKGRAPSAITPDERYHSALTASHDDLSAALEALKQALTARAVDTAETDSARAARSAAIELARLDYAYVLNTIQSALLTFPPRHAPPAEEQERRRRLIAQTFSAPPSDLRKFGGERMFNLLSQAADTAEKQPDLRAMTIAAGGEEPVAAFVYLRQSAEALQAAMEDVTRESNEDVAATAALNVARDAFDRAHNAHRDQVSAVLTRLDALDRLGHYIKTADPAYAARRSSGVSIREEPEAPEVEGGLVGGGGAGGSTEE